MKINIYRYIYNLALVIFILVSCKDERFNLVTDDSNLLVTLEGIEDYEIIDNLSKRASNSGPNNSIVSQIDTYNDFDVITSCQIASPIDNIQKSIDTQIEPSINKAFKNKASTSMSNTVRYRLVFYKVSDNSVVINQSVLAGNTPIPLRLNVGTEYKWVAFSTNEATVPDIDPITKKIKRQFLANKDFLFTSGTFTLQPENNNISLRFERYTTQYVVNLDVRGMFARINDNTRVTLSTTTDQSLFTTADFDPFYGTFSNDSIISFSGNQMTMIHKDAPQTAEQDQKTITFHSVSTTPVAINTMKLNFAPLNLKMDDDRDRVFTTTSLALNNFDISNNGAISSTRGRRYTIHARLLESPVVVQGDNAVSPTRWARANLWYSQNSNTGKYRFRVSPHFRDLENKTELSSVVPYTQSQIINDKYDIWKYNARTPNGTIDGTFDPCSAVYPNGLWKMPLKSDFELLKTGANTNLENSYLIDRLDYKFTFLNLGIARVITTDRYEIVARWKNKNAEVAGSPYNDYYRAGDQYSSMHDLFFPMTGYKNNDIVDGLMNVFERPTFVQVAEVDLGFLAGLGLIRGLNGAGFYWYNSNQTDRGPSYFVINYNNSSLLNLDLLSLINLNLLDNVNLSTQFVTPTPLVYSSRAYSMNIRCVRNSAYVASFPSE